MTNFGPFWHHSWLKAGWIVRQVVPASSFDLQAVNLSFRNSLKMAVSMGHPPKWLYMNSIWVCPILTGLSKIVPQYLPKLGGKNGALPSSQAPSQPEPQPRGGISMPFLNMDRWVSKSKTMIQTRFQPLHIYIYVYINIYIYIYMYRIFRGGPSLNLIQLEY